MIETTLTGKTPDIGEENIKKLMTMFPEVVTEGKVDFEKLKQLLGEYVDDSNERYNFTWNGKGRALRLSQTPSLGTLRPCKEESKNWDTTQNLYIEGDNLEVLKLLQKSYYGKIKMIYIDPPYNTGKDFVYRDDFHDSLENYKRITGQVDGNGKAISTNAETSGRYHTDWLNMMYPRLRLARNLLRDDGVIFISIDDNEVHNLRKICDEVFGEDNFVNLVVVKMSELSGLKMKFVNKFPKLKEYLLVYSKNKSNLRINIPKEKKDFDKIKDYSKYYTNIIVNIDDEPDNWVIMPFNEYITRNNIVLNTEEEIVKWKIENADRMVYRTNSKTVEKYIQKNPDCKPICRIVNADGNEIIKWDNKEMLFLNKYIENYVGDLWLDISTINLNKEICDMPTFENGQKPLSLIKRIINVCPSREDCIILDFFSGSATTAHAVIQLNAEDGGKRRFIMVQLPEPTDENSEACKAGYTNISEIGKERIRRAGEKIREEYRDKENIESLDTGFKVFRLDTSNIRKWQPDYDNLEQSLLDYVDNFVYGRTELDVVYEIMLKYGLDLTYPVDEFTIAQKKVYSIGFGMLMICLDDEITTEVAKGILTKIKELSPESSRVVFKDNGFKSDSNKTNIKEILKSGGIEEFITI
jgi:adenine-specific DNA-methyltransferase